MKPRLRRSGRVQGVHPTSRIPHPATPPLHFVPDPGTLSAPFAFMNWFYAYQGQRAGPVDDDEFARLVGNGTVADQTLVWRSGMADWLPFGQVRATPPTGEPAAGPSSPAALGGVSQAQW